MSFQIIRDDITRVKADIIVNTANPNPTYGGGTDAAIYRAAGEQELLAERKKIGTISPGNIAVTPAFKLKAKYIIHTVGPVWSGGNKNEFDLLTSCYKKSLEKAVELGCKSIAFPLISTGVYGFPRDKALQIAMSTLQSFVMTNKIKAILVIFGAEAFELSGQIFEDIQSFVDQNYVDETLSREYSAHKYGEIYGDEYERLYQLRKERERAEAKKKQYNSLEEFDFSSEQTFQEKLFALIDERGLKDSYVYNTAHMSKAFFSKMRMDRYYQPTKKTVLAIAIVLKLSFTETQDLLNRAGLTFSRSNKLDVILEACIRNGLYKFEEIDCILIKNNLDTLRKYK